MSEPIRSDKGIICPACRHVHLPPPYGVEVSFWSTDKEYHTCEECEEMFDVLVRPPVEEWLWESSPARCSHLWMDLSNDKLIDFALCSGCRRSASAQSVEIASIEAVQQAWAKGLVDPYFHDLLGNSLYNPNSDMAKEAAKMEWVLPSTLH